MTGRVFDIQHFSIHDGPGIRTVVFLKGCNLRCYWCHNPESQSFLPEIGFVIERCISCGRCISACPKSDGLRTAGADECDGCGRCVEVCYAGARKLYGKDYTVDEILDEVSIDRDLYDKTGGGVTVSGGEPFSQGEFLRELLTALKSEGIHTAVESAVFTEWSGIEKALPLIDLFICDIKSVDDGKHIAATSKSNRIILENIRNLSRRTNLLLRTPVIPGFNDGEHDLSAIADFIAALPKVPKHELLPFNGICKDKYKALNRTFIAENRVSPTGDEMKRFAEIFRQRGIDCSINE
ncbi:MAG: glycyl-radical enzyme activating protein [Clostridiaceae bacterium]|jgi:pyruvate formate lyase activating enzyme|nr:glycyl-radical enzyme activating protein [Clostridiaceae bacterium]